MSKPAILIDFDHTLFDTDKLSSQFDSYQQVVDYVTQTPNNLDQFLYSDSEPFLNYLLDHFTLFIFTEAEPEYQTQKINKTLVSQLIPQSHLLIYPPLQKTKHLPKIIKKHHPIALIDDKPEYIDAANQHHLYTIRLKRGKYVSQKTTSQPDFTYNSLQNLQQAQVLHRLTDPIKHSQNYFFTGIKGVGVTPVALCLKDLHKQVAGSDTQKPQITDPILKKRHITIKTFTSKNITPNIDTLVYSGAYNPQVHPELKAAKKQNIPTITQAHMLKHLVATKTSIATCGVGGKTTTSAMLAYTFHQAKKHPSWFVGTSSFCSLPPGRYDSGQHFIFEADEYAINSPQDVRSKLELFSPQTAICTNLTFDHPDIFKSFTQTQKTFINFFSRIQKPGHLVINHHTKNLKQILSQLPKHINIHTFGASTKADWTVQPVPNSTNTYSLLHSKHGQHLFKLKLPGHINALNAAAAFIAAWLNGVKPQQIIGSLQSFQGLKRRQEHIQTAHHIDYFDDYAHHPHEIQGVLQAFRQSYPQRRLIVAFQAHTYSRTKSLLSDFATSFTHADIVITTKIFSSAREISDKSISGQTLADKIASHHPHVNYFGTFNQIIQHLKQIRQPHDIIITLGAGNIYQIHHQL